MQKKLKKVQRGHQFSLRCYFLWNVYPSVGVLSCLLMMATSKKRIAKPQQAVYDTGKQLHQELITQKKLIGQQQQS